MGISEEEIKRLVMKQKRQRRKWDAVAKYYSDNDMRDKFLQLSFDEVMKKYDELFETEPTE